MAAAKNAIVVEISMIETIEWTKDYIKMSLLMEL